MINIQPKTNVIWFILVFAILPLSITSATAQTLPTDSVSTESVLADTSNQSDQHVPEAQLPSKTWQAGAFYGLQSFNTDRPNWTIFGASIQHRFRDGVINIEAFRAERIFNGMTIPSPGNPSVPVVINLIDTGVTFDGYFGLWKGAYANTRVQLVADADVLPIFDATFEAFQSLSNNWEVAASLRRMSFPGFSIRFFGLAGAKYLPNWYLRAKVTMLNRAEGNALQGSLMARRYFGGSDNIVELQSGYGNEVVAVSAGEVDLRTSWFLLLKGQLFFTDHFGAYLITTINNEAGLRYKGFVAGILYRW